MSMMCNKYYVAKSKWHNQIQVKFIVSYLRIIHRIVLQIVKHVMNLVTCIYNKELEW